LGKVREDHARWQAGEEPARRLTALCLRILRELHLNYRQKWHICLKKCFADGDATPNIVLPVG
jgi:hypothetical protein